MSLGSGEKAILVTVGAGFIGSHVIRRFVNKYPKYHIYNLVKIYWVDSLKFTSIKFK